MKKKLWAKNFLIFTARKRSCGKVMFLHLSVILFTGGCVSQHASQVTWYTPPPQQTHPRQTHTPQADTHTPGRHTHPRQTHTPQADTHTPGRHTPKSRQPPQADTHTHTPPTQMVNELAVRFLLERILVFCAFSFPGSPQFSPVGVGYTTAYNYNAQGLPVSYNGQVTVDGQVFTVDPNQQVIRNTEEIDLGKSSTPHHFH